MITPDLSSNQQRILESLVELVDDETQLVGGEEIAAALDRNPGTIRNQMQSLRALQLIEGVPGPRGGYKPTAAAYRALDSERLTDPADVLVERNGQAVDGVNVEKIDFETVHDPDLCRAEVSLRGPLGAFSGGDRVVIGPTPSTDLRIWGTVEAVNSGTGTVTLDIDRTATSTEPIAAD
jgi:hypothetical protein